jgi:hypothetical protein
MTWSKHEESLNPHAAYLHLESRTLTQLIQPAFPGRISDSAERATGGLSSTIYRVRISGENRSLRSASTPATPTPAAGISICSG